MANSLHPNLWLIWSKSWSLDLAKMSTRGADPQEEPIVNMANMVAATQCTYMMTLGRTGELLVVHQITVPSTDNAHSLSHAIQHDCEVIAHHVIDLEIMFEAFLMSTCS